MPFGAHKASPWGFCCYAGEPTFKPKAFLPLKESPTKLVQRPRGLGVLSTSLSAPGLPSTAPIPHSVIRYAFQILNGSPCLALIDSESLVFKAKVGALKVSDQRTALVINHCGTGHCLECECSVQ